MRVRLYDTYTRSLVELPPPPGPGADVLLRPDGLRARAHRQRAAVRGRHVAALVAARDAATTRSSSTTSRTSTTRSTTPRRARAPSSPRARPSGTSRTPATSGSACPTSCRRRPSRVPQIVDVHRGAGRRAGTRTRAAATSTSASRASPSTAGSPGSGPTRSSRARSRARSRRIRATSRSGRRTSPRPRTRGGTRRGAAAGRAGTSSARRWPRRSTGRRSRSTAAGSTSSSRTTRTRSRSRARSGIRSRRSGRTTGCSGSPARRCRSRSATSTTIREALDEWGREAILVFFLTAHWRKPIDYSEETMAQAAARRETLRNAFTLEPAPHGRGAAGTAFAAALDDDFDTPAALAVLHDWASTRPARAAAARRSACSGSSRSRSARRRRRRSSSSPSAASQARAERDFETLGPAARRARRGRLADARRARRRLRPRAVVTPDLVYGRRAVREALRGPARGARALGDRARRSRPSRGSPRRSPRRSSTASSPSGPRPATTRASSRSSSRTATPTPTSSPPAERPLLAVLDRVTDPRNLGAVCRSAEGAGATGVVVPAHGSAVVTPAVARASAGAVEHLPIAVVTNLARYLEEVKGPDLWVYGAAGEPAAHADVGRPTSPAASRSCSARRGRDCGRSSAARATRSSRSRSRARSSR